MQDLLIVIILSTATVFLIIIKKPSRIKNYPSLGTSIVAFGDSLVLGKGATEGKDFVSLLSKKINEPIINLGVSGNTSLQALERVDDVVKEIPKVVMVLIGGNDYLHTVPVTHTFENIDLIVERIQESGAVVILLGIQGGIVTDPYAARFKEVARKRGALLVDNVLDGIIEHDDLMSDEIHPNDKGYAAIAEKVYPVLKKVL